MSNLKGLYIEDDKDNIDLYVEFFSKENLELIPIYPLLEDVEDYYKYVLELDADFIIVDNHLDKQVEYQGIDVLKSIRQKDSNLYAVLLTNYDLENYKKDFSYYDYELNKRELLDRYKDLSEKIKRACNVRTDNQMISSVVTEKEQVYDELDLLKAIKKELEQLGDEDGVR